MGLGVLGNCVLCFIIVIFMGLGGANKWGVVGVFKVII